MTRNLKEHILEAASRLFYSQGIKSTGVDAIVKAAGTTKMSLYKYFPSKDDLVLAHLAKSRESMRQLILHGIATRATEPRQKLLVIFDVFEELLTSEAFRGCPFINAAAEFADEGGPVQCASADFYAGFRDMLAEFADQAGIKEADSLAKQLAILIAGAIVGEQMQRHSGAMQHAREAAEILIESRIASH